MFNKNFKKEPTDRQKLGEIGENCACDYLKRKGYKIIERNYSKKWGEIDIVAKIEKMIHFIEVKSVSREKSQWNVNHETYRPEDNVHPWKLARLGRVVQSYLLEREVAGDWQFDAVIVYVDVVKRISRVSMLEDIII